MTSKTDVSHIWLGLFTTDGPGDFFVERHDREDDEPLSHFAASQGEQWYDHDFVEISFLKQPRPVTELVKGHSYWEQYIDSVLSRSAELGLREANVFVMASKHVIKAARSVDGRGFRLLYVGEYECQT
jgi:hypothetical protein